MDDNYIGKFKSSGMIISSGTGSTGWLNSARRFTRHDVEQALSSIGAHNEPYEVVKLLANELSDSTRFARDCNDLFFYVREPTIADDF